MSDLPCFRQYRFELSHQLFIWQHLPSIQYWRKNEGLLHQTWSKRLKLFYNAFVIKLIPHCYWSILLLPCCIPDLNFGSFLFPLSWSQRNNFGCVLDSNSRHGIVRNFSFGVTMNNVGFSNGCVSNNNYWNKLMLTFIDFIIFVVFHFIILTYSFFYILKFIIQT